MVKRESHDVCVSEHVGFHRRSDERAINDIGLAIDNDIEMPFKLSSAG
jgi:hypothetical protein